MRKKSQELLRALLRGQSKSAILGLQADLRKLTHAELGDVLEALIASAPERAGQARAKTGQTSDGSPVSRVVHLLRSEANLTDEEAIVELKRELGGKAGLARSAQSGNLETWAMAACEDIPAGEMLGAALTIAERRRVLREEKLRPKRRARKGKL